MRISNVQVIDSQFINILEYQCRQCSTHDRIMSSGFYSSYIPNSQFLCTLKSTICSSSLITSHQIMFSVIVMFHWAPSLTLQTRQHVVHVLHIRTRRAKNRTQIYIHREGGGDGNICCICVSNTTIRPQTKNNKNNSSYTHSGGMILGGWLSSYTQTGNRLICKFHCHQ